MDTTRNIPLTNGQVAQVNACDYEELSKYKWYAWWSRGTQSYYAVRNSPYINGRRRTIRMHRVVMGLDASSRPFIDHINHDTLDNRKENLRIATTSENGKNQKKPKNNRTGFKGVTFHSRDNKFYARIGVNFGRISLGYYDKAEDAARAYDAAAIAHHGKYAQLNFEVANG